MDSMDGELLETIEEQERILRAKYPKAALGFGPIESC
jgi:hypothetical protein